MPSCIAVNRRKVGSLADIGWPEVRRLLDKGSGAPLRFANDVHGVGALGHVATDEETREAGAIDEDPIGWAENTLLTERTKELLLD